MRRMTQLVAAEKQVVNTTTFLGYNHNEIIQDGEMYDMENLSGDQYPILSLRKKRAYTRFDIAGSTDQLTGINGRDQLTFVLGTKVYYNFVQVTGLSVSAAENMIPKKIVNFGAYVCIWPDKKYFNTVNQEDQGSMERPWSASGTGISLTMCRADGTDYDTTQITVSETAPANPDNGALWIDQSGENDVLRQWARSTGEWVEVATTFVKIAATGIGAGLKQYDCITVSGLEAISTASTRIKAQVEKLNGSMIIYQCGTDNIVVAGLISNTQSALKSNTVHADLLIPDLDYVVESNNRLWGCKYGMVSGEPVNMIRASALGDFRNWQRYLGNSQDSYYAAVGTDGPFTAAVTQKGYPVFLKENCIHQVYGNTPTTFQISTVVCRGVQQGSWRSAVVVNEQIYYKSRKDIMMFDGSQPVSVSRQLGNVLYSSARAGALDGKYYISMRDINGGWHLFTYDTVNGIWYREDNFKALGFGAADDDLYAIQEDTNRLAALAGGTGVIEDDFPWKAEFGLIGTDYRNQKYLSRFDIRLYLEEGCRAQLEILYDDDTEWQDAGEIRGTHLKSVVMPVIPRRCDHLRFRIRGEGDCRIYSISRIMEVGSDGGTH